MRYIFNKRTAIIIAVIVLSAIPFAMRYWLHNNQVELKPRNPGYGGPSIEAFDRNAERLIEEMRKETLESTIANLSDPVEYYAPKSGELDRGVFLGGIGTYEKREEIFYAFDMHKILVNRQFRKAFQDLQKCSKKEAAKLLTEAVRKNLEEARKMFQEYRGLKDKIIGANMPIARIIGYGDDTSYRGKSIPNAPPTRMGCRFAVFSYLLLAAQLELKDMRPIVAEVAAQAEEELQFCMQTSEEKNSHLYLHSLMADSLYQPSILATAALCDPKWNTEAKKRLAGKLVTREIVDYSARALEYDWPAAEGWVPVEPDKTMLKIRYYEKVTDDEFKTLFQDIRSKK